MFIHHVRNRFDATAFLQMKKKLLIAACFARMFFSGVEYSVIFPTAYLYMKSFSDDKIFMGLVIAAYPFSSMVSLPIFGYLYDRTRRIRELMIILNMFQMVGNIVYSLHFSIWLPIFGRLIVWYWRWICGMLNRRNYIALSKHQLDFA